jgi:hypothetical protein
MLAARFPGGEVVDIEPGDYCHAHDLLSEWATVFELKAVARQAVSGPVAVRVVVVQTIVRAVALFHVELHVEIGPEDCKPRRFWLSQHSGESPPTEALARLCEQLRELVVELAFISALASATGELRASARP